MKNEYDMIEDMCYEVKISEAMEKADTKCKHIEVKKVSHINDNTLLDMIRDYDFKPIRNEFFKVGAVGITIGLAIVCLLKAFNYYLIGVNLI